jgi:hypothetical protein
MPDGICLSDASGAEPIRATPMRAKPHAARAMMICAHVAPPVGAELRDNTRKVVFRQRDSAGSGLRARHCVRPSNAGASSSDDEGGSLPFEWGPSCDESRGKAVQVLRERARLQENAGRASPFGSRHSDELDASAAPRGAAFGRSAGPQDRPDFRHIPASRFSPGCEDAPRQSFGELVETSR